jgi:inner membrane protein
MDSITQITLGAAVGEAFAGKKTKYKAAAWGAFLGTLPDLDVLANPLLDNVSQLYFHRGLSHSVLFCLLASPLIGWAIDKVHSKENLGWKTWSTLAFWVFITHIFIDLATTYGTQIFSPFTNRPFTLDSVFIIDPLFTIPVFFGLMTALLLKSRTNAGSMINKTGLVIGAAYLVWGWGIKSHVNAVFVDNFEHQYGYYHEMKTTPNGPSSFLWNAYIIKGDTIYQSVYSIFDEDKTVDFEPIPRNSHMIEPYVNDRGVETLLWFSRGYYTVQKENDKLVFYDLRFGRSDLWLTDRGDVPYVWRNEILFDQEDVAYSFNLSNPSFEARSAVFDRYWKRLWGEE